MISFVSVFGGFCILIAAQDFKTVHDGVEYAEVTRKLGDDPIKINLLRLDLKKVRLDVHHAMDAAIGTEQTSSIAHRHGAIAAINAGFFRLDKSQFAGDAAGLLMVDGKLISEAANGRIALRIINEKKRTEVSILYANIRPWFGSKESPFQIRLNGINREAKDDELVVYTSDFGPSTKRSNIGTDIVLSKCAQKRLFKHRYIDSCDAYEVVRDASNTSIPTGGYVVSLGSAESKDRSLILNELKIFDLSKLKKKSLSIKFEDAQDSSYGPANEEDIIAGVPQLIKNGKIDITWEQEKSSKAFVETRHPRTAVAKMKDGKFLMITVDGRQPGVSVGMNLNELAEYLLDLGAVDAMNLDGGGSTTMFLDGRVVNKPSDKEGERKVGDAILVTLRKKK